MGHKTQGERWYQTSIGLAMRMVLSTPKLVLSSQLARIVSHFRTVHHDRYPNPSPVLLSFWVVVFRPASDCCPNRLRSNPFAPSKLVVGPQICLLIRGPPTALLTARLLKRSFLSSTTTGSAVSVASVAGFRAILLLLLSTSRKALFCGLGTARALLGNLSIAPSDNKFLRN